MPVRALRSDTTSSKRQGQYQYSPYVPPTSVSAGAGVTTASAAHRTPNRLNRPSSAGGGSNSANSANRALTPLIVLGGALYLLLQGIALRQNEFRHTVAESKFLASHRHMMRSGGEYGGDGSATAIRSARKIQSHNIHIEDGEGNVDVIVDGGVSNIDMERRGLAAGGYDGRGELRVRLPDGKGEMLRPAPMLHLKVEGVDWDEDRRRDHGGARGGGAVGGDAGGLQSVGGNTGGTDEWGFPDEAIPGDALFDADGAIDRAKDQMRKADRERAAANRSRKANKKGRKWGGRTKHVDWMHAEAMRGFHAMEMDANADRPASLTDLVQKMMPDNIEYAMSISAAPDLNYPDVPIFWSIPESGNDVMKTIVRDCLKINVVTDLTKASEGWGLKPEDGVVMIPDIWNAIDYLDGEHRGRLFMFVTHPVHRAVRMFEKQKDKDPTGFRSLGDVMAYARSKHYEPNWMVRHLAGVPKGDDTTVSDLAIAKEVLRTKFIVGLVPYFDGSIKRFEKYFGWYFPQGGAECRADIIREAIAEESAVTIKEGSPDWVALVKAHDLDTKLYQYANHLFFAQKDMFD